MPAGILEDRFATSSERGITPVFTRKQENRGIGVHIILHGLGPLLICAGGAPLQSAVPLQSAPRWGSTLQKIRSAFNLNVSILQISLQVKPLHSSVCTMSHF